MRNILVLLFAIVAQLSYGSKWTDTGNYDTSWYNDLSTSFNLSTPEEFAGLIFLTNNSTSFSGKKINITSNIDMNKHEWAYCNTFDGELNGNGYCISNIHCNLTYTNTGTYYAAIFRNLTETGIIHNIKFNNVSISVSNEYGQGYAGGITSTNYGVIHDCEVDGYVSAYYKGSTSAYIAEYYAGGISAYNYGTIINCTHSGEVESLPHHFNRYHKAYAGGIAGKNEGIVANCINYGSVYAKVGYNSSDWNVGGSFPYAWAGGICGTSTTVIQNTVNFANITSTSYQIGSTPGKNAYADGICASGSCLNSYYSSSLIISAPSISKNGLMLSINQLRNKDFDFTGTLNSNLKNITSPYITCWGNSSSLRDNEPFLLNNISIEVSGYSTSQNSIYVEAIPNGIQSNAIIEKGFEYKSNNGNTTYKVILPNEFSSELVGLNSSSKYEVRAYIKTNYSTIYSKPQLFTTNSLSVETLAPTEITPISAQLNGKVSVGSTQILSQGFLWKDNQSQYKVIYTVGKDFYYNQEGLKPSTSYCYQAFIVTLNGDNIYGNEIKFSTSPLVLSLYSHYTNTNSVTLKGYINIPISNEIVIEYRKKGTSTYSRKSTTSSSNGNFDITITELDSNSEYEFRGYMIYDNSYIYSSVLTIKLDSIKITTLPPTVSNKIVFYGQSNASILSGEVGFEYRDALSPNIIPSEMLTAHKDENSFWAETNNVTNNVKYKVRAYYKDLNEEYAYGDWVEFTPNNVSSNIIDISSNDSTTAIFDIYGRKLDKLQTGINIIIYSNGTIIKVVKK